MKMLRGTVKPRRDGGWKAKNLSGAERSFWPTESYPATAEERAIRFANSVCQYRRGGGQRFVYPGEREYEFTLAAARQGRRASVATPAPLWVNPLLT